MVVDLTIENDPNLPARATAHWLIAGGRKVDDRKPPKTQAQTPLVEQGRAFIIRSSMTHFITHRRDQRQIDAPLGCAIFPNSANTTHLQSSQLSAELRHSFSSSPGRTATKTKCNS